MLAQVELGTALQEEQTIKARFFEGQGVVSGVHHEPCPHRRAAADELPVLHAGDQWLSARAERRQ